MKKKDQLESLFQNELFNEKEQLNNVIGGLGRDTWVRVYTAGKEETSPPDTYSEQRNDA